MAVIPIAEPRRPSSKPASGFALFALGFRPFYLLAALLALGFVPFWVAVFTQGLGFRPVFSPVIWHGHEMVFGFACAVIVGFLLTAVRNWTGLATPTGKPLAALVALWLAGRLSMLSGPAWLAAPLDISFLPLAAIALGRVLLRARNRRNYFVLAILGALTAINAWIHAAEAGWLTASPLVALRLAIAVITLLETTIAGRIVPGFTSNALKVETFRHRVLDLASIALTAAALLSWVLQVDAHWLAPLAGAAALCQAARSWGWRPTRTWRLPILWILHLSHAWIVFALMLIALGALGWGFAASAVVHLLTVGAMAGLILGMITRTALGHTGRLLVAGPIELMAYLCLQVAAVARVAPILWWPALYRSGLYLAAGAWALAFGLYLWRYAPMLIKPRVDGREG